MYFFMLVCFDDLENHKYLYYMKLYLIYNRAQRDMGENNEVVEAIVSLDGIVITHSSSPRVVR